MINSDQIKERFLLTQGATYKVQEAMESLAFPNKIKKV